MEPSNVLGDDEDNVEEGDDFIDEIGRIIVNDVEGDVFVGTVSSSKIKRFQ